MLITVEGIVIGRRNVGDNSCFLDILTKEYGVIEVTANAVKKLSSKNLGSASIFSYAVFCLNKSGLRYTINSTEPKYSFYGIAGDIKRLSLAVYFADIIKYTSASEQSEKDILRFLAITLYELEHDRTLSLIKSVFELKMSVLLGLMPDLRACRDCVCYDHKEMYFVLEDSNLICGDCYYNTEIFKKSTFLLNPSLLYAMRYVVYTKLDKLYKFELTNRILKELGVIAEEYLLYQLGRSFRTLDYFKKL